MQSPALDIEFSLSELEQAGLLDYTELQVSSVPPSLTQRDSSYSDDSNAWQTDTHLEYIERGISAPSTAVDQLVHPFWPQPNLTTRSQAQPLAFVSHQQPDVACSYAARAEVDRRQASNREHQKRFRTRQKARSQAMEAQLASTTAELRDLKARQSQLELLLQQAHISSDQNLHTAIPKEVVNAEPCKGRNKDGTPLLSVSLSGRQAEMTTEEVVGMSITHFSALWADYIREIGACLLQLHGQAGSVSVSRAHQLVFEAIRLVGRRLRLNPTGHRALITSDARSPSHVAEDKLKPEFYISLLGLLGLSDDQLQDMMLLRQLYITRRHILAVHRKELMAGTQEQTPHPIESVTRMSDLANQLKENAWEDHHLLYNMSRAFFCGVLTMKQAGIVMVHSFPKMPVLEEMLNTFAAERGFASEADLVDNVHTDMEAEWMTFWRYTKLIDPDVTAMYDHVPLYNHARATPLEKATQRQGMRSIPLPGQATRQPPSEQRNDRPADSTLSLY